ncbi:MAG TPA: Crp/Fnr family transcriptional regulator [Acetobacteraceae bacterium]
MILAAPPVPARNVPGTSAAGPSFFMLAEAGATPPGPPNLIASLKPAQREMVLNRGRRRVFHRGSTLFSQGEQHDGLFIIESGMVKVFYTALTGREITLAYWYPGNFVGGPSVFQRDRHVWTGVAARNTTVVALSSADLRYLIAQIPEFCIGIVEGLSFKGKCYSALAQMLGTRSISNRLELLLQTLCELYGVAEDGGIAIRAAFSHQDLANMVGATRQWVTISLTRLQVAGVLSFRMREILVCRPVVLAIWAGGGE